MKLPGERAHEGLRNFPPPEEWDSFTAYDAIYVALAEQLDATLVTFDARLARAPRLRIRAGLISLSRFGFGVALIGQPKILERGWIGKQARLPGEEQQPGHACRVDEQFEERTRA